MQPQTLELESGIASKHASMSKGDDVDEAEEIAASLYSVFGGNSNKIIDSCKHIFDRDSMEIYIEREILAQKQKIAQVIQWIQSQPTLTKHDEGKSLVRDLSKGHLSSEKLILLLPKSCLKKVSPMCCFRNATNDTSITTRLKCHLLFRRPPFESWRKSKTRNVRIRRFCIANLLLCILILYTSDGM
eukprot:GILJ01032588.1.p1 GENE.GILJ01032588.1~~GILJ01032588.1.p1  ORF type:complete len:187 (+),score=14.04 GILJ01032588.1:339-899(+)